MNRRLGSLGIALILLAGTTASVSAEPAPVTITSAIAAGVISGPLDAGTRQQFGTSSVVVPAGEQVTFLAVTDPPIVGRRIEIWTRSRTSDWQLRTVRLSGSDGSIRYFATISEWTAFQARYAGDAGTAAAASHGRIATASANGLTAIGVTCDEFAAAPGGRIQRAITIRSGDLVSFTLCSNASTGFSWETPAFDATQLQLVSHRSQAPAQPIPGAPGTETWTFRILQTGTSSVSIVYSQPWAGGQKAAWQFDLDLVSARQHGLCSYPYHLDATAQAESLIELTGVRVRRHAGFDRIVFTFAGTDRPSLDVAIVRAPFTADPSGLPVSVDGTAYLQLTLRGATGAAGYSGPTLLILDGPRLMQLVRLGDFEGVVSWVAGMTGRTCYRVSTLTSPTRIVVDLVAP